MDIYKCAKCGAMVEMIKTDCCTPSCCGQPMDLMVPGTTDAATEKHVPIFQIDGDKIIVKVGTMTHPMEEVHYIEWIAIETEQGTQRKYLKPCDEPKATFSLTEDDTLVAIYEHCNLHGLWKAE